MPSTGGLYGGRRERLRVPIASPARKPPNARASLSTWRSATLYYGGTLGIYLPEDQWPIVDPRAGSDAGADVGGSVVPVGTTNGVCSGRS